MSLVAILDPFAQQKKLIKKKNTTTSQTPRAPRRSHHSVPALQPAAGRGAEGRPGPPARDLCGKSQGREAQAVAVPRVQVQGRRRGGREQQHAPGHRPLRGVLQPQRRREPFRCQGARDGQVDGRGGRVHDGGAAVGTQGGPRGLLKRERERENFISQGFSFFFFRFFSSPTLGFLLSKCFFPASDLPVLARRK